MVKPSLVLFLTGAFIIYFRDKSCLTGTPSTFLCYPGYLADTHAFLLPSFSGRAHLSPQLKHRLRRNWPQVIFSLEPLACYQTLPISICLHFPTLQKLSSCPSCSTASLPVRLPPTSLLSLIFQSAEHVSAWKWLPLSYQHPPVVRYYRHYFFLDY